NSTTTSVISTPNSNSLSTSSLKKINFKPVYFLVNEYISLETISTSSSSTTTTTSTSTSTSSPVITSPSSLLTPFSPFTAITVTDNNTVISHIYPPRSFLFFLSLTIQEYVIQKLISYFNLRIS